MADFPVASRKNDFIAPPRAFLASGGQCQVAVLAVSTTAIAVDLTQGISQAPTNLQLSGGRVYTPTRNYLSIEADVDIGVVFGPTLASVTGGNVPSLSAAGTLGAGANLAGYIGTAGTCLLIKAAANGQAPVRFMLGEGVDLFLGIVATGTGLVRFYQSSPDDA